MGNAVVTTHSDWILLEPEKEKERLVKDRMSDEGIDWTERVASDPFELFTELKNPVKAVVMRQDHPTLRPAEVFSLLGRIKRQVPLLVLSSGGSVSYTWPSSGTAPKSFRVTSLDALPSTLESLGVHESINQNVQEFQPTKKSAPHERLMNITAAVPGVIFQGFMRYKGSPSFTFVSDYSETLLGIKAGDLQQDSMLLFERLRSEDRVRLRKAFADGLMNREVVTCDVRLVGEKEKKWVRCHARPVDASLEGSLWTGFISDVTQEIEYAHATKHALQLVKDYNGMKEAILTTLSHEIRTPLAAIIGFADLLKTGTETTQDIAFHASMIRESGKRLQNNLSAVLELARLRARDYEEFPLTATDISSTVREILPQFKQLAEAKNIEFVADGFDADTVAIHDPEALRFAIKLVLDNAIKFTEQGSVRFSVQSHMDSVVLSIKDTGVGISREFLPLVFEEFQQESKGLDREFEGCGLGLSLARKLVRTMGGTVRIQSQKHVGTEVLFLLGVSSCSINYGDGAPLPRKSSVEDKDMLVVGLNESYEHLFSTFNARCCQVDFADEKDSTDTLLRRKKYHVVVLDIDPADIESDLDLIRYIRSSDNHAKTPIVACTSSMNPELIDRLMLNGVSAFLAKPFNFTQLCEALISSKL